MEVDTALGKDVLLFYGMHALEELGRVGEFQIDLLSEDGEIKGHDMLGTSLTVKLQTVKDQPRHFNGYVTRFAHTGRLGRYHRYLAVVRPWLWFLSRTSDCRIFQNMKVPDILKAVFNEHGADFALELSGAYEPWIYCVQYRETDLNFVSRLMEHEGIYYYVRHKDGHHTVVLVDSASAHSPCPDAETVPYYAPERLVRPEVQYVSRWTVEQEVEPGAYVHEDYDMERPSVKLRTQISNPKSHAQASAEIYDYPGGYVKKAEGNRYAEIRLQEHLARHELVSGTTNHRAIAVGGLFTLENCPRQDQNREYLVVSTTYDLEYGAYEGLPKTTAAAVRCTLTAMDSKQPFRPKRTTPKPFVQGPQTAVVVGPAGDEIYTDKYGRVKVQFHWDRYGKRDENSSCWVRVSHPWAGKAWGAIAIPRIGQEVIVDFLEGDPDQPIITGRVYNAEQMPPYGLPANMTQTGIKSRSSKNGSPDNFNEIRFEDKKGSEQLFIHAEKNQDIEVENDETHWVGHDRQKTIDHDETTHVKHDRTETVDNNETITVHNCRTETVDVNEQIAIGANRSETVGANETIDIGANRSVTVGASETKTVALQRSHTVGINETITVGATQEVSIGAAQAVTIGANQTTSIGAGESRRVSKNRATEIGKDDALKVGKNLTIEAGDSVTIKTGSASIMMKKDGTIQIKGKDITVEGSGKINVKASSNITMKGSKILQN